jgi:sigma-B regulation protein RsbU (phosphoserine phosphatase)
MPRALDVAVLVNAELCRNNPRCMFVTLFMGFLDLARGRMNYVNAGHVRPYLLRADGVRELECGYGVSLGVTEQPQLVDAEFALGAGEALVVLTDGLPEMLNAADEFYTLGRVCNDLAELRALAPGPLVAELCRRVLDFAGDAAQADDVTVLALRLPG